MLRSIIKICHKILFWLGSVLGVRECPLFYFKNFTKIFCVLKKVLYICAIKINNMNILNLNAGDGIKFESQYDLEMVLPVMYSKGYTDLSGAPLKSLAKMVNKFPLYVSIEKDKQFVFTTSPNFDTNYIVAIRLITGIAGNTCTEHPDYKYTIEPNDALKLLRNLSEKYTNYFKILWGDSILADKIILVTEMDKEKYLTECRCFHSTYIKCFKPICRYKTGELILVRDTISQDWMPRFFSHICENKVVCFSARHEKTCEFTLHCKAKVTPA